METDFSGKGEVWSRPAPERSNQAGHGTPQKEESGGPGGILQLGLLRCNRSVVWELGAVAALLLLVSLVQLAWIAFSEINPEILDFPVHATLAWVVWDSLAQGDFWRALGCSKYGPVGYLPAAVLFSIWGPNLKFLAGSQVFWVVVLALSLFFTGRRLYGPGAGFLACLYLFTMPLFASYSKSFVLEIPSQAIVMCGLAILVCGRPLQDRGSALLFGILLGLLPITKPEALGLWLFPLALLGAARIPCALQGWWPRATVLIVATIGVLLLPVISRSSATWDPQPYSLTGPERLLILATAFGLLVLGYWRAGRVRRGPVGQIPLILLAAITVYLPVVVVEDPRLVLQDRVQNLILGLQESGQGPDLTFWTRFMAFKAFGARHLSLLLVGVVLGFLRREIRHPKKRLIFVMLIWSFVYLHLVTMPWERYMLHLVGCAALVATGWAASPPLRRWAVTLLLLLGMPALVGWLLPSGFLGNRAVTFELERICLHPSMFFRQLVAPPPLEDPGPYIGLLRDLQKRAPHKFVLLLLDYRDRDCHRDILFTFAMYHSIACEVLNFEGVTSSGHQGAPPPRIEPGTPRFLLIPGEMQDEAGQSSRISNGGPPPPSRTDLVGVYRLPAGSGEIFQVVRVYRLAPSGE